MELKLSDCKTPCVKLGLEAVGAEPGTPIATASCCVGFPGDGFPDTISTRETLYSGLVKPAVSSIVEPPAPGAAAPEEVEWC